MIFKLPKIYPITDTELSGLSHTEQVRQLIEGGARIIQLREKHRPSGRFFEDAITAVELARKHGVTLLINDRADIAAMVKADGVHLGQDDLPPSEAREILGPQAIIGFSTHNVDQAIAAVSLPIDYIAIGPIFSTSTKPDPDPVVGTNGICDVRKVVGSFPIVAIGGINAENIQRVFLAGADSAAMIAEIAAAGNRIAARMQKLAKQFQSNVVYNS